MIETQEYLERSTFRSIDSLPIRETSPTMLDMDRVDQHIAHAVARGRIPAIERMTYLFRRRCLVDDVQGLLVTPAGVLCFAHQPQEIFPHAIVNLTHYRSTSPDANAAIHIERNIGGTIFDQISRVEEYLNRNTHRGMAVRPGTFERVELEEYPSIVRRELTVNMIAHRDYQEILSASRVQLFADHIEWMNPGGLPEGMTIDQLLVTQRSRNPALFMILLDSGLIEGVGQGLDTVVSTLDREGMAPPQFAEMNRAFFVASVSGRPHDMFSPDNIYGQLTDRQRRILAIVRSRPDSSSSEIHALVGGKVTQRSVQRDIRELLERDLLATGGSSHATRYHLRDKS